MLFGYIAAHGAMKMKTRELILGCIFSVIIPEQFQCIIVTYYMVHNYDYESNYWRNTCELIGLWCFLFLFSYFYITTAFQMYSIYIWFENTWAEAEFCFQKNNWNKIIGKKPRIFIREKRIENRSLVSAFCRDYVRYTHSTLVPPVGENWC